MVHGASLLGENHAGVEVERRTQEKRHNGEDLDGDVTRKYLSKGLGFSKEDRDENIRRVGFVCSLLTKHGAVVTAAFVSPYRSIRDENRKLIGNFVEVYVKCSVEKCMERDVKGMYKKAIAGEIKNFTGVSDPFEEPEKPELVVETDKESEAESLKKIIAKLEELGYLRPSRQGHPHPRLPAPGPAQDPGQPEFSRPDHVSSSISSASTWRRTAARAICPRRKRTRSGKN